jgi:hypothetical protein
VEERRRDGVGEEKRCASSLVCGWAVGLEVGGTVVLVGNFVKRCKDGGSFARNKPK